MLLGMLPTKGLFRLWKRGISFPLTFTGKRYTIWDRPQPDRDR